MLNICCIRAGASYAPAYVDILFDSVRRNLAEGFEGKFICFTDQPETYSAGIEVRPLPADLPGWWSKLALFRPGLFPDGDRILFLDLDTLITGRLDEFASYKGPFAIIRGFYDPSELQSAVMAWGAGDCHEIWDGFVAAGCPMDNEFGDQAWITRTQHRTAVRWQDIFPGAIVSYKQISGPPDNASIVCFHGRPRPHEVHSGWVPQVWKVGGLTRAELDVICNTIKERLAYNVHNAIARDLQWFDIAPPHDGQICIVGGGPSLSDTLADLKWRISIGQKVWALNGAGRFLVNNGIIPDAVVIADAREENADFLYGIDKRTRIYLASQCHPSLFDKAIKERGVDVILWHVNTEGMVELLKDEKARPVHLIGGGSTVGMNAMVMAFAQGYRKQHLYGFDSCYLDDRHHAYPQTLNDHDRIVDALYGDRHFKIAPWMAQQVNDFQELAPALVLDGCIITIAGDGLLQAVARDMAGGMPLTPAQLRANEVLKRLNGATHPRGAEVGVFAGDMSAALLRGNEILHLDMIDSWEGDGKAYQGDSGDWHAQLSDHAQEDYRKKAFQKTEFAAGRRTIHVTRSTIAAKEIKASYDFVFLDADHSKLGCSSDLESWFPKVKRGGWLCGHDYESVIAHPKFGVKEAVDEFVQRMGLKLELGENSTYFIRVPDGDDDAND